MPARVQNKWHEAGGTRQLQKKEEQAQLTDWILLSTSMEFTAARSFTMVRELAFKLASSLPDMPTLLDRANEVNLSALACFAPVGAL